MQSANSKIRIALIGAGGQGNGDLRDALLNKDVELAAAADIYDGRLTRIKEVHGAHVFTTRDYARCRRERTLDA